MRAPAIATFVLASTVAWAGPPQTASTELVRDSPDILLARAQQAYARSDYSAAIAALKPLLYPTVEVGADDEVRARKKLAMSYFFQDALVLADQEFNTLLQLNPAFALDPVDDPPKAIAFLEGIRRKNRDKLEEMAELRRREEQERARDRERQRREAEEAARRSLAPLVIERTIERHHLAYAFIPFGVGQLQNGDRKKAWFFLSTEAILGAASVSLWAYYSYNRTSSQIISYVPVMLGAAFWIEAAAGVIDALAHYQAVVVVEKSPSAPAPSPVKNRVGLAPFVAPGGGGLTLQGVF